jgi:hypothetical protein
MFGVELYNKHFLILNKRERKVLTDAANIIDQARERAVNESNLDLELASIEYRIADLLDLDKIEID